MFGICRHVFSSQWSRSPSTDSNASLCLSADCVCVEQLVTHLYECVYVVNFPSSSNSLVLIMRAVVVLLLLWLLHRCCCSCLCFAPICCPICFLYFSYFSLFCNFVPIFFVSMIPILSYFNYFLVSDGWLTIPFTFLRPPSPNWPYSLNLHFMNSFPAPIPRS